MTQPHPFNALTARLRAPHPHRPRRLPLHTRDKQAAAACQRMRPLSLTAGPQCRVEVVDVPGSRPSAQEGMMPLEIPPPFPPMPPLPLPPGPAYSGYAGSMVWPDQHGALAAEGTSSNIYMPEPWTTWQAAPMPGYAHAHQELSPGTVMGVPVPGFYPASVG